MSEGPCRGRRYSMPLLLHIVAQKVAQEHRFESFPVVIGRLPGNQIVLADSQISRRHARLVSEPGGVHVEDLNSTNFVFLNGKRVMRALVTHGDVINVGGAADFIYLARRDDELVAQRLASMPAAPAPASVQAGEKVAPAPAPAAPAPPADPPAPRAPTAEPTARHPVPPPEPAAQMFATQAMQLPPRMPSGPQTRPSVQATSAPCLEDFHQLQAMAVLLLGPQQTLDEGLKRVIDEAVAALHARRGFLFVKTTRIGQPDVWQVKLCRSADGLDIEDDEKSLFALELIEHAAATEETTRSGLPGLDEQIFGARPLPRPMREAICAPLKASDWVLGALYCDGCKEDPGLLPRGLSIFDSCAQWAAVGLEKQRLAGQLAEQHQRFLKAAEELKTVSRRAREYEEALEKLREQVAARSSQLEPQAPRSLGGVPSPGDVFTSSDELELALDVLLPGDKSRPSGGADVPNADSGEYDFSLDADVRQDGAEDWENDAPAGPQARGGRRPPPPRGPASRAGMGPPRSQSAPARPAKPPPWARSRQPPPEEPEPEEPELPPAPRAAPPPPTPPGIVMASRVTSHLFGRAQEIAQQFQVVLLTGELGTGKKTLARTIHGWSARARRPFIHFPCGAYRDTESERRLFGWVEARTRGGGTPQAGQVERARGGVLFLEDVDLLSGSAQARLDQLLGSGSFCRVGSDEELEADVLLIASTTRNLKEEVERGNFDRDLYYFRLGVVTLSLRPLSERPEDLADVSRMWLEQFNKRFKRNIRAVSGTVMQLFHAYPWRGNLTELRATLEAAVMNGSHRDIEVTDLPAALQEYYRQSQASLSRRPGRGSS
ncbi:MAG: sigma 54-interacting transcriptional regulator [Candidatus Wallbacteria bacterium]|nr:sigma 54-interacting transcriptional regulator [Candidatus Wallbacteria bacterium]